MSLLSFTITDGDSLQGIAMRVLGDTSQWVNIAQFNRLHSPFLSNDIRDYYGNPSAKGQIATVSPIGSLYFDISPAPQSSAVQPGGILLLGQYNKDGQYVYNSLIISDYIQEAGIVWTTTPCTLDFDIHTQWFIYPSERPTKVLRTGDTLFISTGSDLPSVHNNDKYYDVLGTDFLLDDNGKMHWTNIPLATGTIQLVNLQEGNVPVTIPAGTRFVVSHGQQVYYSTAPATIPSGNGQITLHIPARADESGTLGQVVQGTGFSLIRERLSTSLSNAIPLGTVIFAETGFSAPYRPADIQTVSNVDNVRQAILSRLSTRLGELAFHPEYGNHAFDFIGAVDNETTFSIIEAWCVDCLRHEQRIENILNIRGRHSQTETDIQVVVSLRSSGQKVLLDDLRLRFIGDN